MAVPNAGELAERWCDMARDPAAARRIAEYWAAQDAAQSQSQNEAIQRVFELQRQERERIDAQNAAMAAQNRAQQEERARMDAAARPFAAANQAAAAAARLPRPRAALPTQAESDASYAKVLARQAAARQAQDAAEAEENARMSAAVGAGPSFKALTGFETEQEAKTRAGEGSFSAFNLAPTGQLSARTYQDVLKTPMSQTTQTYLQTPEGRQRYEQQMMPDLQRRAQAFSNTPEGQKFATGYAEYQKQLQAHQQKQQEFRTQQDMLRRAAVAAQRARQKANIVPAPQGGPKFAKGGEVKASRGDGCAQRGKTKGRMR